MSNSIDPFEETKRIRSNYGNRCMSLTDQFIDEVLDKESKIHKHIVRKSKQNSKYEMTYHSLLLSFNWKYLGLFNCIEHKNMAMNDKLLKIPSENISIMANSRSFSRNYPMISIMYYSFPLHKHLKNTYH
jgi:hypothetical protein